MTDAGAAAGVTSVDCAGSCAGHQVWGSSGRRKGNSSIKLLPALLPPGTCPMHDVPCPSIAYHHHHQSPPLAIVRVYIYSSSTHLVTDLNIGPCLLFYPIFGIRSTSSSPTAPGKHQFHHQRQRGELQSSKELGDIDIDILPSTTLDYLFPSLYHWW